MRLKKDYIVHSVGDEDILLAVNEEAKNFHGIIKLNKTASKIVSLLQEETTLDAIVLEFKKEYPEVDETTLRSDIEEIIEQLRGIHVIEE